MISGYRATTFSVGNEVNENDYFTEDGVETTFQLVEKDAIDLANVVQHGLLQPFRNNGGFTVNFSTDEFTLLAPAAYGTTLIAPARNRFQFRAYRQAVVTGVVDPNISETIIYIADITQIGVQKYVAAVDESAILLRFIQRNTIDSGIPEITWLELAQMQGDGTAGTYGAPGDPLLLGDIVAESTVDVASLALDTILTVDDGTDFAAGQFIIINITGGTSEVVRVVSVLGDVLTVEPMQYAHSIGETVYHCGWGAYVRETLPTDDGDPINWFNISTDLKVDVNARD